jgi:hypothetical protein
MKKALLIGINYIKSNVQLNGCIDDIVNMNAVLQNRYYYDQITMLRDDTTNPSILPTRKNILNSLTNLISESANCSEIWIHYSGHGSIVRDYNGDEASGYDSVIVPVDFMNAGYIVDDDLYNIIKNSKCKTMILMDSCNSGSVIDLPWSYTIVTPYTFMTTKNNKYSLTNQNIFMFSGCKDNQTSADVYSVQLNQAVGAFTNAFLICLQKANYQISLLLLYRNVCIYLNQSRFSQIPVYSSSSSNPLNADAVLTIPPKPTTIMKQVLSNVVTNNGISTDTGKSNATKSIHITKNNLPMIYN